jgi:hypothetical protein
MHAGISKSIKQYEFGNSSLSFLFFFSSSSVNVIEFYQNK